MNAADTRSPMDTAATTLVKRLTRELDNFRDIAKYILPTPGDVRTFRHRRFGGSLPLSGSAGATTSLRRLQPPVRPGRPHRARHRDRRRRWWLSSSGAAGRGAWPSWTCRPPDDRRPSGARFPSGVLLARLRAGHLRSHHASAVSRPDPASTSPPGAQVRVDDLGEIAEDSTFGFSRPPCRFPLVYSQRHGRLHGGRPRDVHHVSAGGHAAVVGLIDRSTTTSALGFRTTTR